MNLTEKFLPPKEISEKLSYKDQKKVNILLIGNIACFIAFLLFSLVLFMNRLY